MSVEMKKLILPDKNGNEIEFEVVDDAARGRLNNHDSDLINETIARTTADTALSARMDTFTQLPNGSTSGDAELIDIRVDVDGKTHDSAGSAVRRQTAIIKNKINKINKLSNDLLDGVIWELGSFYHGEESTSSIRLRSEYIDISDKGSISISLDSGYKYFMEFYDASKEYKAVTGTTRWTDASKQNFSYVDWEDAKYVRFIIQKTNNTVEITDYQYLHVTFTCELLDYIEEKSRYIEDGKININTLADALFDYDEKSVWDTQTGWKLDENGYSQTDANYKIVKYAVTEGTFVKVMSDHAFQFQNKINVPSSGTTNRVGEIYFDGQFIMKVPTGAKFLVISTLANNSIANCYNAEVFGNTLANDGDAWEV